MMSNSDSTILELLLQHWVPVLVIGAGVLLPICAIVFTFFQKAVESWRQSHVDQYRAATEQEMLRLKQSMIARGMSADEIERVLRAEPQA
jgi:hypothetical protein